MPVLTLSSDIGNRDFLIAAIKGEVLLLNEQFNIVDITHQLTPFNYYQANYVLRNSIRHFPEDSFHIILINLFQEKPKRFVMAEWDGKFIAGADNGLISMMLDGNSENLYCIDFAEGERRDTFGFVRGICNAFNELLAGKKLSQIANRGTNLNNMNPLRPTLGTDWMDGQILFIDNFENVIVNITREQFEEQRKGRSFRIVFRRNEELDKISESYADVPEGEKLALFNSAGYLEIAINRGNAAGLFGLQGYSEDKNQQGFASAYQQKILYQSVRINFE